MSAGAAAPLHEPRDVKFCFITVSGWGRRGKLAPLCHGACVEGPRRATPGHAKPRRGMNIESVSPGCKPVHLWLMGRHGTRHGKEGDIELIYRLPKLQNQIRGNRDAGREY